LSEILELAANIGAERFVLDDGWFGTRDDDTQSLGDWEIDPRKYPEGLGPLIAKANQFGMSFGIWFEPEMVNLTSKLYVKHPSWVLGSSDQILGRNQLVLDMANPDVQEYLFEKISAILADHNITYIKWDHNRVLPHVDAAQTYGTYKLMSRLRDKFPNVEIESCASGGGRIDFGILKYSQRVWLSDSNDALERLRIQHQASNFLPMAVTGSHVGPRECHTSGRTHDIEFRAWVAAQRLMGFEMDPRELTPKELSSLKNITQWWKDNRIWRHDADIHRLNVADNSIIAEIQVSRNQDKFVVFVGIAETSKWSSSIPIHLTGLKPDYKYDVILLNYHEKTTASRGASVFDNGKISVSGQYLMSNGIILPSQFPDRMWVLEGTL
jgi:alpha-galactosidase